MTHIWKLMRWTVQAAVCVAVIFCTGCTDSDPAEPESGPSDSDPAEPESGPSDSDPAESDSGLCVEEHGGIGEPCCSEDTCLDDSAVCLAGSCARRMDCLDDDACPAFTVVDDPPSTAPNVLFIGYADPSIRRATDGTLYMGYSWPTLDDNEPQTRVIEAHLAMSLDEGATWSLVQPLFFASGTETIPGTADQGVHSSEEITILPAPLDRSDESVPYWISVRLRYCRRVGLGAILYQTYHLRVGLTQDVSPASLADGVDDEQVLLTKTNSAAFRDAMPANHILFTDLLQGTEQTDCDYPVSPTLHYDDATGHLYMVLMCIVWDEPHQPDVDETYLIVLRTTPFDGEQVLPVTSWQWDYRGRFGGRDTAALMQVDGVPNFVPNILLMPELVTHDDELLLVVTPAVYDAEASGAGLTAGRTGCQVLEMESLDPPALAMRDGQPIRHALVDAPDLDATRYEFANNVGSCAYEPSATGIGLVLARKHQAYWNTTLTSTLHDTGVRP